MDIDIKIIAIAIVVLFVFWNLLCDGNEDFHLAEHKFPPKDFVMLKRPCKYTPEQKRQMELERARVSQVGTLDQLTHRGPHEARNTGFNPKYHSMKTTQYLPSWPNVSDNYANIDVVGQDLLADQNDFPVLRTSDKVDVANMIY
jgi:hypothetical protein